MKKINYILPLFMLLITFGCSDFDELNMDPTKSTDMDPNLQIPTIQMRQTENHQEWHRYLSYPTGFMNQWTGNWSTVEYGGHAKKYDNFMEQMWVSYYPIIIRDVVDVVQRTKDQPELVNVHSIARILRVQCFLKLTDFYGDVPYFDAGMGYYNGVFKPKYDKQEDIYNDFFKELEEACTALDPDADLITHDLYYNGNIEKWKKFGNSLRLRIAMRLTKADPAKARQQAEAAIAAGVFESNDDICFIKHENFQNPSEGVGKGNGLAIRLSNPEDPTQNAFRLTTELVKAMEDSKDPRILYYGGCYYTDANRTDITAQVKEQLLLYQEMSLPAQSFSWDEGIWRAPIDVVINGATVAVEHNYQRLQPSKLITAFDAPYLHMSYAEVKFLMAEAAFRGWNTGGGDANTHFQEGLEAAVRQWSLFGVSEFDERAISDFKAFNTLTAGKELLQINTQLWVLHFMDPMETWANWRRSGMPAVTFYNRYPAENQSNGQTPRRLQYPTEEQLKNKANYDEAITRMGGTDDWLTRVWWDKE
ncbi:MAG: SusD/RagB family nutrient-binding outer membrane lipoprotein [Prolixibacteraceae bacterium]